MPTQEVALTLTSGQLWAGLIVVGGAFCALVVYMYTQETARTQARFSGLSAKIDKEVAQLRADFTDKITAQNTQLDKAVTQITSATVSIQNTLTEFDRRLLKHETRMGG